MKTMTIKSLLIISCTFTLAGCWDTSHSDLKAWIKAQEQNTRGRVEPLPRNMDYVAIPYEGATGIDPFKPKQVSIVVQDDSNKKQVLTPEMNRRKEPLEYYNISEMAITGFILKDGQTFAMIKSQKDNIVHTVGVGNYLGTNFGKILKIADDKVFLRELLLVGSEWNEKITELQLYEDVKKR